MIRPLAGLLLIALGMGCELPYREVVLPAALPSGEIILALNAHEHLLLESLSSLELAVDWSDGSARCEVTARIAQSWEILRGTTSAASPDLQPEMALDPNQSSLEAVMAFARRLDNGQFEIRHVEGDEQMLQAATALQTILDECGLNVTFEVVIYLRPSSERR